MQNVYYRPKEKQALADQKKSQFHQPEGDHITLLEVYKAWQRNRMSNAWCYENFLQARTLRRAQDVRKQLITHLDRSRGGRRDGGRSVSRSPSGRFLG